MHRSHLFASVALVVASPVVAQTVQERLEKARTEVNTVENAAARAQTAIKSGNLPKATTEINATKNAASRALYAIDKAIEAVKPHEHPPAGDVPSPTLDGAVPIKSEFDYRLGLRTLSEASQATIKSAAPDVVGAFRFTFGFAGLGRFDPKVYHCDTTGKSHLHEFYGNTDVNPCSTYETLRRTGKSTTNYGDYPLNRSAYWDPAMLDGKGNVVRPDNGTIYYKQAQMGGVHCTDKTSIHYKGQCVPLPHGLFFIFGYDMLTGKPPTGSGEWGCIAPDGRNFYAKDIPTAVASGLCVVGGCLVSRIHAPSCWDGKRLDSANHRDHVAYPTFTNPATGRKICDPETHPYVIPEFTLLINRYIREGDDPAKWRLDSDPAGVPGGTTYHADFFMAHDPDLRFIWNISPDGCLGGFLNCSSGTVSKTQQLLGATAPQYRDEYGRLVTNWRNPRRSIPVPGTEANTKLVGGDI